MGIFARLAGGPANYRAARSSADKRRFAAGESGEEHQSTRHEDRGEDLEEPPAHRVRRPLSLEQHLHVEAASLSR